MESTLRNFTLAFFLAVTVGLGAPVAQAAQNAPTVSRAAQKPLSEAQQAIGEKKYDEALAKLATLENDTKKTPYDTFVMHQLKVDALNQAGRLNEAIPSLQAEIDSGFLSPEDSAKLLRAIAGLYFQAKDYAKAVEVGQQVIAAGNADDDTWLRSGSALYLSGKVTEAGALMNQYLAETSRKNVTPAEGPIGLLLQSAVKTKDTKGTVTALEKLVQYYPTPERWRDLLLILRDNAGRVANDEEYILNIYRLMRETGSLKEGNEYVDMAATALKRGSPGEASDAIRRGTAANALSTGGNKTMSEDLRKSAQLAEKSDRASLAQFEIEAKSAKAGESDVRLGQAYLSYDQPDKAVEALARGVQKGSLRNPDEAQILLGLAYLKVGKKPEAQAAFAAAKGQDPKFGELARLWGIFARS